MFERRFSHFLSYGATDQQTLRELTGSYRGLIVPGTVAAFQGVGTGGFVLSLSAKSDGPPYLIDPRFPLFQTVNREPKKSHLALAELLGAPELVREDEDPLPADFDPLIETVAANWVRFNSSYQERQGAKFEKYARRLAEEVEQSAAKGPDGIIAPYLVAADDEWWKRSKALYGATAAAAGEGVLRVIAAPDPGVLARLLAEVPDERLIVWVSDLKEPEAMPSALAAYGEAIRAADQAGKAAFALYGGFFSVLLASCGLRGACHGIGYGEHRSWPELSQSGPPPPRYYAPRFHRYISQDLAYQLWSRDADLTGCGCGICQYGSPLLDYHDLMKHSVHARQAEIDEWAQLDLGKARERLQAEGAQLSDDIEAAGLPDPLLRPARAATRHLSTWSDALDLLDED